MRFLLPAVLLLILLPACYEAPVIPDDITVTHEFSITAEDVSRAVDVLLPIAEVGNDIPPEVLDSDTACWTPTVCLTAGQVRDVRDFVVEFLARQGP